MLSVIETTASKCFVPLTVGGGIRTVNDIDKFLRIGADKVSINSSAVSNPKLINEGSRIFGNQCIVVAIDAKKNTSEKDKWNVYTHGGRKDTGIDAVIWAMEAEERGAGEILLTSMDKDGTKKGFDIGLTKKSHLRLVFLLLRQGVLGH